LLPNILLVFVAFSLANSHQDFKGSYCLYQQEYAIQEYIFLQHNPSEHL